MHATKSFIHLEDSKTLLTVPLQTTLPLAGVTMQDNEDMEYHSSIDQLESHQIGDDEDDGQTWTA